MCDAGLRLHAARPAEFAALALPRVALWRAVNCQRLDGRSFARAERDGRAYGDVDGVYVRVIRILQGEESGEEGGLQERATPHLALPARRGGAPKQCTEQRQHLNRRAGAQQNRQDQEPAGWKKPDAQDKDGSGGAERDFVRSSSEHENGQRRNADRDRETGAKRGDLRHAGRGLS